jgi:hypothetical protein
MNCRRRRTEEALQVGLRRRSTVHRNVDVDKRQVLALLLGRLLAHSFLSLTKKRGQTKFFGSSSFGVDLVMMSQIHSKPRGYHER